MPTIPVATLSLPPSVPENFTFTPDGKALLGNSYYTGVSNVFRLDIASGKYDVLTNAATGFFRPQLRPDGSLFVYDYTGDGFNPSIVQPQVREDLAPRPLPRHRGRQQARPSSSNGASAHPPRSRSTQLITAARHLRPDSSACASTRIIRSSRATTARRRSAIISTSPTRCSSASSAPASPSRPMASTARERFHANVEYQTPYWKLTYWHNLADVYDLAGPVLRSRKGDAVIANYTKPLIYDPPRQLDLFGSAAAYFGLDQLPGAQNIPSPKNLRSARDRPANTPTPPRRSAASITKRASPARIVAGTDQAQGHFFPRLYGGVDVGTALPWAQQLGLALCPCRHRRRPARQPARRLLFRLVPQQLRR